MRSSASPRLEASKQQGPLEIVQVLLLQNESGSKHYGMALWAACHEVEEFYNFDGVMRLRVKRIYVSPHIPSPAPLGILGPTQSKKMRFPDHAERRLPNETIAQWRNARIVEQKRLLPSLREELQIDPAAQMLVLTDSTIRPPPEWRYIIWDGVGTDSIVSSAPLDPDYWDILDKERVRTIKRRARAAMLSVCGEWLNEERCRNFRCYLYDHVDSVTTLDSMDRFGSEHTQAPLVGLGFADKQPPIEVEMPVRIASSR